MSGPSSPPIDIAVPNRYSSASPRNQASNLTSALQEADNDGMDVSEQESAIEAKPPPRRQDSLGQGLSATPHGGTRPISVNSKPRRESNTGSFMGGMSWGGISVGSMLQDDIAMGGTSPYNFQSPSYHSSSYLPKMEANFWSNLKCCDITFGDLHELLQHFEEVHSQAPSTFPYRTSVSGGERLPRRKSSNLAVPNGMPQNQVDQIRASNQMRGFQPGSDFKMNGAQPFRAPQPFQNGAHKSSLSHVQDMETIGEMEMDDDQMAPMNPGVNFRQPGGPYSQASSSPVPNINPSMANNQHNTNAYPRPNQMPLDNSQLFQHQQNPMVSSVNTPSLNTQPTQQQQMNAGSPSAMSFSAQGVPRMNNDFGGLDFGNGNEMRDLCINEPAKALFGENGTINTQQFPNFNFSATTSTADDEAAKNLHARQIAIGMAGNGRLPGEEERPFKCPVIGCEKAYKNANGLRYHEKHGHSTQKLKENSDGTFSIVDPETSIPYPGTVGMEKEKPYRCEVCGKRYKNLNGLKYHRNHSPPCNPDFDFNSIALSELQNGMTGGGMTGESIY